MEPSIAMMAETPRRKNRRRDSFHRHQHQHHHQQHQYHHQQEEQEPRHRTGQSRRYDAFDSYSISSSSSGGTPSPPGEVPPRRSPPLLQQRRERERERDPPHGGTGGFPACDQEIGGLSLHGSPTPTTTMAKARSPRSGKLGRARRRGHRSSGTAGSGNGGGSSCQAHFNAHGHKKLSGSGAMPRSGSLTSIGSDSVSELSLLSRYTAGSKSSGTSLSRRGGSTSTGSSTSHSSISSIGIGIGGTHGHGHGQHPQGGHSCSSGSLFGLTNGATYSSSAGLVSEADRARAGSCDGGYHKDHHDSHPHPPASLPPLPSVWVILSELCLIGSLCFKHAFRNMRKPCHELRRRILRGFLGLAGVLLVLVAWLSYDFYADVQDVCTPPPSAPDSFSAFLSPSGGSERDSDPPRPLVEYYVHGRGTGHYVRSVAIVEQLNRAGIDVRMFLTRAAMWRAMHEDARIVENDDDDDEARNRRPRGTTTAIAVTSLTPGMGVLESLSHTMGRVSGDCEVSEGSGRYPQLVVTDGDFPGMLRAELGGIPSVAIAHGQLFSIGQKPAWIRESKQLNTAWDREGRLNSVASAFTEWQIATHFCFLESRFHSGTVARPPLRPEILGMSDARGWARKGKLPPTYVLPQEERIRSLLLPLRGTPGGSDGNHDQHDHAHGHAHNRTSGAATNDAPPPAGRRKLVICYFRDHNGENVVNTLLSLGVDVLVFDPNFALDMPGNPNRYGAKWIIHDDIRDRERTRLSRMEGVESADAGADADTTNGFQERRRVSENADLPNPDDGLNATSAVISAANDIARQFKVRQGHQDGPKVIRVTDRSLFVPLMHVADGVASSAGSQLMSECIYSRMPLLAMYKEKDNEQRLNVELSQHADAPCHRPLVYGTSFEDLESTIKSNAALGSTKQPAIRNTHGGSAKRIPIPESFYSFVREVRSSSVSDTYYRNAHVLGGDSASRPAERPSKAKGEEGTADHPPDNLLDEEDPFQGLPDAAAIIVEIVKQVIQKG